MTSIILLAQPHEEFIDEEIADVLVQSIVSAGRLPRQANVLLAGVCVEHRVDGLDAAVHTVGTQWSIL
jgi:hypothetical protein